MFTGIIKAKGSVTAVQRRGTDVRLTIAAADISWSDYEIGESVAVNGVCLTAIELHDREFVTDVSVETLTVTTLGSLVAGTSVNLEPAMKVGDRFGGHIVSGHVDCSGVVTALSADGRSTRLTIELPQEFARYIARKGSVCIDGVSLTINEVSDNCFELNIIPHTAKETIVGDYAVGTIVNIEVDLVARYLERLLRYDDSPLTVDFLRANGYA